MKREKEVKLCKERSARLSGILFSQLKIQIDLDQKNVGNMLVNIVTKVTCTGQIILTYAVLLNVFEIFFYLRIFDHMNR